VNVSHNVNLFGVLNALVLISPAHRVDAIIGIEFIREDGRTRQDVLSDHREQCATLYVASHKRLDAALAFHHADDCYLLTVMWPRPSRPTLALAAHVGFVHLYALAAESAQCAVIVHEHTANLFEHPPSGLVGNASLALNLLCRDSAARGGHQVNGIEPRCKRRRRLVKDRVGGRVNVMSANVAGVGRTANDTVMFGHLSAGLAENPFRVEALAEPFETARIIGKPGLKVL